MALCRNSFSTLSELGSIQHAKSKVKERHSEDGVRVEASDYSMVDSLG